VVGGAAVRAAVNALEVDAAAHCPTRSIAAACALTRALLFQLTTFFEATAAPFPAGLAGPVTLVVEPRA
jgi:hypothetical protein